MATYTDNYNLVKPTMAETADIRTINGNMDTVDDIMHASQISLAPAYDSNETYNTGDVVMYEFLMYECLDDDVTGTWDSTKWQRTTAGEHGGGSDVEITPTLATGTKIADFEIDGVSGELYAPSGGGGVEVTGEASGTIASFADGSANPLKSLVVDINPVQAGSGTPSPSNPRAISGWSSVGITVEGKNLFETTLQTTTVSDVTFTVNDDGTITTSGTPSANISTTVFGNVTLPAGAYKASGNDVGSASSLRMIVYNVTDSTSIGAVYGGNEVSFTLTEPKQIRVYPIILTEYGSVNGITFKPMIRFSEFSDSTFEPYDSTTTTISLGQTVYGGKLNVTTGELTVDRALVEYDGSSDETWDYVSAYGGFRATISDANINGIPSAQVISNRFVGSNSRGAVDKDIEGKMLTYISASDNTFLFFTTQITDLSEWKEWLSENITQVEYPLATPTTISLTPTEVDSLLGSNNILADSGDSDVVYIRDIDKAFNILWNAVMNSNSGTRSLNLMKGAISETKEDIEEPIKEEETKEGKDENQR